MMKNGNEHVCPRCDYPLLPVHSVQGRKRRVIALTCPEPYCDHIEFVPANQVGELDSSGQNDARKQVS